MKKLCAAVLLILIAGVLFSPGIAEESGQQKTKETGATMHQDGKCPMCGMMMGSMQKSMVSVDGGVVVMAGNRLMKYDKDLNLVKEAEVKVDMKKMHEEMMKTKEEGPRSGKQQHPDGKAQ